MTHVLPMPASAAWRVLGTPRRGIERLHVAPSVPGYRVLRELGTGRRFVHVVQARASQYRDAGLLHDLGVPQTTAGKLSSLSLRSGPCRLDLFLLPL